VARQEPGGYTLKLLAYEEHAQRSVELSRWIACSCRGLLEPGG
jgi:hypothetical protein